MLENKTLFLLLSRGDEGYAKGDYNEHMDFQSPYLKSVFNIIGISNIHIVAINGRSSDAIDASYQNLRMLIEQEVVSTNMCR
jgi:FMN-dependent NADH-azoreductase